MRTWRDVPELSDADTFRRILKEEGSFDRVAKRVGCGRTSNPVRLCRTPDRNPAAPDSFCHTVE